MRRQCSFFFKSCALLIKIAFSRKLSFFVVYYLSRHFNPLHVSFSFPSGDYSKEIDLDKPILEPRLFHCRQVGSGFRAVEINNFEQGVSLENITVLEIQTIKPI